MSVATGEISGPGVAGSLEQVGFKGSMSATRHCLNTPGAHLSQKLHRLQGQHPATMPRPLCDYRRYGVESPSLRPGLRASKPRAECQTLFPCCHCRCPISSTDKSCVILHGHRRRCPGLRGIFDPSVRSNSGFFPCWIGTVRCPLDFQRLAGKTAELLTVPKTKLESIDAMPPIGWIRLRMKSS